MQLYRLHTNEGVRYVRSTDARLRKAMYAYIKAKRAAGMPLSAILYAWCPLHCTTI